MKTAKCELYVLVDEAGDYVASHDQEQLKELYEASIQDIDGTFGIRVVKVELTVPLPTTTTVKATLPEQGDVEATVSDTMSVGA